MLLSDTIKGVIWEWYSRYFHLFLALSKIRMLICLGLTAVQPSFDLRQEGGHQEICTIKYSWQDCGIYTRRRWGERSRYPVFSFSSLLNSSPSLSLIFPASNSSWSLCTPLYLPFSGRAASPSPWSCTSPSFHSSASTLCPLDLYLETWVIICGNSPGPAHPLTKL